jgi:hypothetical protein
MLGKNGRGCSKLATLVLSLLTIVSFQLPGVSAEPVAPVLKPITAAPSVDPNAEEKPRKALQGGLQMTESGQAPRGKSLKANTADSGGMLRSGVKGGGFLGKLRGGARTAPPLQAKAQNSAPLTSQATSGFGIIGVKFVLTVGRPPVINRVFPGTPAYVLGMQKDDAIVAVDGVPTYGLTKEEVYDLIIGSPGTTVNISVMRASGDFKVYTCTRMDINDLTDPLVRRDYLMSM